MYINHDVTPFSSNPHSFLFIFIVNPDGLISCYDSKQVFKIYCFRDLVSLISECKQSCNNALFARREMYVSTCNTIGCSIT